MANKLSLDGIVIVENVYCNYFLHSKENEKIVNKNTGISEYGIYSWNRIFFLIYMIYTFIIV